MKKYFAIILILLPILTLAACSDMISSVQVTREEALAKAVKYYPEEVSFQYAGQGMITDESDQEGFVDQECHIFDVIYGDKRISGVAVGVQDGGIWFRDMNDDILWLSESFMGLPGEKNAKAAPREPVIEINRNETTGAADLYFAHLDTIPELSCRNEGSVSWNEKEKILRIWAVKVTGSVTGAPAEKRCILKQKG